EWPRQRYEIAAHRRCKAQYRWTEPHAPVWRCRDDQFLGLQCGDDALHGGACKIHSLCDLAETETRIFFFKRTQNGGRPSDHLNLAFVVGDQTTHNATPR